MRNASSAVPAAKVHAGGAAPRPSHSGPNVEQALLMFACKDAAEYVRATLSCLAQLAQQTPGLEALGHE